jgi:segregation and condensation protein A
VSNVALQATATEATAPHTAGFYKHATSAHELLAAFTEANEPPQDALDILLDLARSGKINPWDIDLTQLADEYLKAVGRLRDSALQVTGKTLLYLAILLRIKSDLLSGQDYLTAIQQLDVPQDDLDNWGFDDGPIEDSGDDSLSSFFKAMVPYNGPEELIARRSSTKEARIRPVTLSDLILELKKVEALEDRVRLKRQMAQVEARRMGAISRLNAKQIEDLAHEEFIEASVLKLKSCLADIIADHSKISLDDLMEKGQLDQIAAYVALLFLSAQNQVELSQEVFYETLWVSGPNETLGEVSADDTETEAA